MATKLCSADEIGYIIGASITASGLWLSSEGNKPDRIWNPYYNTTKVEAIIDWITDELSDFTDEVYESTSYTEYYTLPYNRKLTLKHRPVISITSIYHDNDSNGSYETLLSEGRDESSNNYYLMDEQRGLLKFFDYFEGEDRLQVIYSAGYSAVPERVSKCASLMSSIIVMTGLKNHESNDKFRENAEKTISNWKSQVKDLKKQLKKLKFKARLL